ncbi:MULTISPECIES: alpha-amylase family glycosyl hydrolase [Aerosakkonema]|uniref:alpha-amylase family glycosyl hydrolase n=1 Tax=Aerosakkonema TaxID=1246629 RepID=UPI0035B82EFA
MPALIEFKLLAPNHKEAKLKGSFSNWEEISMEKDDNGYFRAKIALDDGIYQYKFRVQLPGGEQEQWVEVNDPYVTAIDPATGNGIVRIKEGEKIVDTYVWQHDDKPLPGDSNLVIYELFIADFSGGEDDPNKHGQYKDVIEKLDYLCELGINAIELMPVNKNPTDYSWGYSPEYYFAPQPNYGSTEDLKRLIDECHGRGIRVILDQLYNHSSEECPLQKIDRDYWYYHDRHHPEDEYYWGPEFNYEYWDEKRNICPAKEFMGDVVRFWIQEYHIDGIRYDALKQLDNPEFLHWLTQEAKKTAGSKPFYNIGEHVPENVDMVAPKGPMDGCWHDSFFHFIIPHLFGDKFELEEELKKVLDPKRQEYPEGVTKVINYISNHDQKRLLENLGERNIFDAAAFGRVKLGVAILMTAVGVPTIRMGEEFGEYTPITLEHSNPLKWSLLKNDRNRNLFEYFKGLITLRKQNPALQTANIEFFHENPEAKVFAYVRWNDEGSRVVVVANFSDKHLENYEIPNFPANGTWHEWTNNYDVESKDDRLVITLAEYEAKVFVLG